MIIQPDDEQTDIALDTGAPEACESAVDTADSGAPRPVIIWCTSRSYSSLVAKIFINHGVWWGNTVAHSSSYVTYENQSIKKLVKRYKNKVWQIHICERAPADNAFVDDLRRLVPANKQWMYKGGAEYFQSFQALNPYNIFVFRDASAAARSMHQKNSALSEAETKRQVQWRYAYMEDMLREHGGCPVYTDFLIQRDLRGIQAAIEYCGLTFDEQAALAAFNDS